MLSHSLSGSDISVTVSPFFVFLMCLKNGRNRCIFIVQFWVKNNSRYTERRSLSGSVQLLWLAGFTRSKLSDETDKSATCDCLTCVTRLNRKQSNAVFYRVVQKPGLLVEKLRKIFKRTDMQVYAFSRQNSETSDMSHAFLSVTVAKLSTPKAVQFFGPLCIY